MSSPATGRLGSLGLKKSKASPASKTSSSSSPVNGKKIKESSATSPSSSAPAESPSPLTSPTSPGSNSPSSSVRDARRMFEQLSANANSSSPSTGSPSLTKKTVATGKDNKGSASPPTSTSNNHSSPVSTTSRKSPGSSHQLRKVASVASDITSTSSPSSNKSAASSGTVTRPSSSVSESTSYSSDTASRPKNKPARPPPPVPPSGLTKSQSATETIGVSEDSKDGSVSPSTAQPKVKGKGKGKEKEKEKEKEKTKEKEKEKAKEKEKTKEKDKPKEKEKVKEKEKAKEKEKEKEKEKDKDKDKESEKEKDKGGASATSAAGQSKDKEKTKGRGSLFGKDKKSDSISKEKVKNSPVLGKGDKNKSSPSTPVLSKERTSSPSLGASKGTKGKGKEPGSTKERTNSLLASPSRERKGSKATSASQSNDKADSKIKNGGTKAAASTTAKMEDDSSKSKKDSLSSSHSTPKTSPTHSRSGSTTSTPKSSRNVRAGGGGTSKASGAAGATGSLSADGREKGATGGVRKSKPPQNTAALSDKELEINLGEGTTISGTELRAILNKQLVYVSGGLEEDKHPILTFPEVGLKHLDSPNSFKELNTTLLYLKSLMSITDLNAGMTLLLDARNSRTHTPTKHLLEKLVSKEVPLDVHVVYIYTKTNIFGRSKQLVGAELSAKLHISYVYDQKSLVDQLDVATDLGGTLNYNHRNWVYNRLEFEKVQKIHSDAMAQFLKLTAALDLCEVPNSVKDAEHLMTEDLKLKEALANKMAEAELSTDRFLETLKHQLPLDTMEMAPDTKEQITMMSLLNGMLQELKAEQGKFDSFWMIHKARVDHMMRMCHFNRSAEKLKVLMKEFIEDVKSGGIVLGDTLEAALELGEKHEAFVTKCKTTMDEHMKRIREDAQVLINPDFVSEEDGKEMHSATQKAIDSVKTQVEELKTNYKELTDLCQQKRDLFIVCVKFHMTTRQVQQWNQDVLEFLASLPLEDMTAGEATTHLSRIDDLHDLVHISQLTTMAELATSLPGEKKFKKMAEKAKEKYEQTCSLLETRKAHIMKQQAVMATTQPKKSVKKQNSKTVELINGDGSCPTPPTSRTPSSINPEASVFLAKTLGGESSEHTDGESDANVLKSRQFVYKELLATEKVYIDDLKTVLHSYYDAMDPEESTSLPLRLRDKRGVVFGNLPDIHKFHETVFNEALQRYEEHPERVGECFIQFTEEFQMYSVYCKNRTQSEALINECTESQAFFKRIQLNLAHQLSLDSYLLKPVQRITKYQLLLKDMMKHSVNAKKAHSDLQMALDRMLKVLKNLNDSLHVVGLKGFPGSLAEQGRLLVHDPFQVWEESSTSRSLFSRARERHVFLFEKMVIFSKKIEAPVQKREKKSDNYLYKAHLPMAEIGLRPTSDGQPLQFELNIHGQQKVFRFQAQTKEVREMWSSEIRRLLEAQFTLMKDVVLKSGTLDRRTYKGKAQLSTRSRDSRLFTESLEAPSAKKSISERFKLLKRRKTGGEKIKKSVSSTSGISESSLLQSCSLPPTVIHSTKEGGAGRSRDPTKGLSHSSSEIGRFEDADSVSSDEEFTFSDEEESVGVIAENYETLAPGAPRYYFAICDYNPGDSDENGISLTDGQEVEVIGINQFGWWWVRATSASSGETEEGWVPASYLKVFSKRDQL